MENFIYRNKTYDISSCFSEFDLPNQPSSWAFAVTNIKSWTKSEILDIIRTQKSFRCTSVSNSGNSGWFGIAPDKGICIHKKFLTLSKDQLPVPPEPSFHTVTVNVDVKVSVLAMTEREAIERAEASLKTRLDSRFVFGHEILGIAKCVKNV